MNAKHFNHKLVDLQQGERVDGFYQTPEGRFPSVTTVVGWKKNQFFAEWRKKNPKEAALLLCVKPWKHYSTDLL